MSLTRCLNDSSSLGAMPKRFGRWPTDLTLRRGTGNNLAHVKIGGLLDRKHDGSSDRVGRDRVVTEAGFSNHTFVIAPFFYQNLAGALAPQQQADGSMRWALPLDPSVRCIHVGDITELGNIVVGAFPHPGQAGNDEYLPLVDDFMSFNEIAETLNRQGMNFLSNKSQRSFSRRSFPGPPR
jgi:hypothetical protein